MNASTPAADGVFELFADDRGVVMAATAGGRDGRPVNRGRRVVGGARSVGPVAIAAGGPPPIREVRSGVGAGEVVGRDLCFGWLDGFGHRAGARVRLGARVHIGAHANSNAAIGTRVRISGHTPVRVTSPRAPGLRLPPSALFGTHVTADTGAHRVCPEPGPHGVGPDARPILAAMAVDAGDALGAVGVVQQVQGRRPAPGRTQQGVAVDACRVGRDQLRPQSARSYRDEDPECCRRDSHGT